MGTCSDAAAMKKDVTKAEKTVLTLTDSCFGDKKVETWKLLSKRLEESADKADHNLSNIRGFRHNFLNKDKFLEDETEALEKAAAAKLAKEKEEAAKK
jgi:hypothetical protein